MCTAIILIRPDRTWPIVLASIREEQRTRPSSPPAMWWSDRYPGAMGGRDDMAGGTWLAVDPKQQRVAVILNRDFQSTGETNKKTRGFLPLETIARGKLTLTTETASQFLPFNLLYASLEKWLWWRWDGETLSEHDLKPGLSMLTASDLNDTITDPKQRRWLPSFTRARVPEQILGNSSEECWGDWPMLMADPDSPVGDPSALNVKGWHDFPDAGTVCATLLAFSTDGKVRYDFCHTPPHQGGWQQIL